MKLRLPNKLQAALMAALASISFTTLSSGTLSAAFFFGSQAFAEEAANNPGATIDIGDINLDAQAAIDEEEGRGEAKEPGSAPINQAGFNGIRGSSDDFDRQSTAEATTEASIDTENVGTADQANYGSASADLPSNDLGFTSNPYEASSDTSNGSGVDSPVTSFTQAPQIAPTGGYSAADTGSGSSSNKTSPVSVFGNTGSGAGGGGSFGSGISLGSVTKAAPTPVILGAAGRNITAATTVAGDTTYNGLVYTMDNSGSTFHSRVFQRVVYNEESSQWENTGDSITSGNTDVTTPLGTGYFWTMYCATASAGHGIDYGNTLRLTGATEQQRSETQFTDFAIGGLIADDSFNSSFGTPAYWFYRAASMAIVGANDVIMDVNSHVRFSYGGSVNMMKGGTWTILSGKTLTFDNNARATATTFKFYENQALTVQGGGTLNLGRSDNGTYNVEMQSGSSLLITGNSTVDIGATAGAITVNGTITVDTGSTLNINNNKVVTINSGASIIRKGTVSGNGKIAGAGTYELDGVTSLGVTLDDTWTGTVRISNQSDFKNIDIDNFGHAGSSVELNGVTGFLKNGQNDGAVFNSKLVIGDAGYTWNSNGYSNSSYELKGGMGGSGTFTYQWKLQTFKVTGDVTDWNGTFLMDTANDATFKFSDQATVVNAKFQRPKGTLNMEVGNGEDSFSTTFNNTVQASKLTVNNAASATLTKASTLGPLAGTGSFTINSGSEMVSAAGGSIGSVDVQSGTFRLISSLTTANDFTVAPGATLQYNSKLVGLTVGGNLSFATGASLNVGNIEYFAGKSYTLATATGSISYDSASLLSGLAMPTGATNYTLSTSESGGTTSLTLTFDGTPPPTKTLHLYVLTGQSNSLGAVKGDPASPATLAQYSTVRTGDSNGLLMWNGNMSGSVSQNEPSKNLILPNEGKMWQTVAPQEPGGEIQGRDYSYNLCMGPEYGFAYMMQHKGWNVSDASDVAIIKGSRDGGGNDQWVKGQPLYGLLLDTVKTAIKNVDTDGYSTIQLDGLMYLQGESNGNPPQADTRFSTFITNFKADLLDAMQSDPELAAKSSMITISLGREILGEPASWGNRSEPKIYNTSSQLYNLSTQNTGWGFVYTHDLDKITSGDTSQVHYDGNSQIAIGARYAYSMAIGQGLDVTDNGNIRVRSQYYGDTFSTQSASSDKDTYEPVSLNDAKAWWRNADESGWTTAALSNQVAVWDISSANMRNTAQGKETLSADLALKGIRIEDPYAEDDSLGTNHATIVIDNAAGTGTHTLSVGAEGIKLQQGNLTVNTNLTATANQTWNTNDTPANGSAQQNTLTLAGTTTIATGATVTVEGASIVNISTLAGTGGLTVNGAGAVVTLTDKTGFTGATTITSGSLKVAGTNDLDITGNLTINGGSATFAGNITADTVTLSNIGSGQGSFVTYNGTITGKDSITLDNYTVESMAAKLVTQRLVAMGGTNTTIHNLTLTACEVNVQSGSNVTLADSLILGGSATYTGTLNLADGLTIDVSNMTLGGAGTSVALLSTENGNLGDTDISKLSVDFGSGSPAPKYTLSMSDNNLMLTLGAAGNNLIWDNAKGDHRWTTSENDKNWHLDEAGSGTSYFTDGSNVTFKSGMADMMPQLQQAITAGTITVEQNASVIIRTQGNTLTATGLIGGGNVTQWGNGRTTVNGPVSLGSLDVVGGTMVLNSTAGGSIGTFKSSGGTNTTLTNIAASTTNKATGGGEKTLAGNLTLNSGSVLTVLGNDALNYDASNTITVNEGANINFSNARWTIGDTNHIVLNGGSITGTGENAGNGALDFYEDSTVKATDDSTISAPIRLRNKIVTFEVSDNKTLTIDGLVNQQNSGSLVKTGDGTLLLSGSNTYATNTTISQGTLETASATALGTSKVTIASGATLKVSENLTVQGGSAPAIANSGTIEIADGKRLRLHATAQGRQYNLGNVVVDGAATIEDYNFNTNASIASISGSATSNLTLFSNHCATAATWTIGASPSAQQTPYQGTLTLKAACDQNTGSSREVNFLLNDGNMLDGATLKLENGTTGGTLTNNIKLGAETVKLGGINDAAAGTVSNTRKWNIGSSEGTHTLQLTGTGNYSSAVAINSNVNLLKTGSGTQTLSGNNANMNGTVTVNAGTLVANSANALGTGAITVNSGGTLELSSLVTTVSGSMTVNDGGALKLSGASTPLSTTGTFSLAGDSTLDLSNYTFSGTDPVTLVTTTGSGSIAAPADWSTVNLIAAPEGAQLAVDTNGNLVLTFGSPTPAKDLIWDGTSNTWASGSSQHWHEDGSSTLVSFTNHDNATFDLASSAATVTVSGAVTAGSVAVESGANVTLVTDSANTLTAAGGITVDGTLVLDGTNIGGELSGSGVVVGHDIPSAVNWNKNQVLGNLTLDADDWTGTVEVGGGHHEFSAPYVVLNSINQLGTDKSTVRLKGVGGYFDGGTITANIELVNAADGSPAVLITAGNNKTTTFSGNISGSGDLKFDKNGGAAETFKFTGDISQWNGSLTTGTQHTGPLTVELAGEQPQTVNASIMQGGPRRALNLKVDNAATFNNTVKVSKVEIAGSEASATFMGDTQITTLAGEGTLVVNGAGTTTTIGSGTNFSGAIDLLGGTLDLTSALTGVGAVNLGTSTTAATLKLAGGDTAALTSTGTITLGNNLTFDLSNYNSSLSPVEGGTTSVTLATATSGFGDSALDAVSLTGLSLEEGYKASLSVVDTTKLVLTISDESKNLVWLDSSGTWTARNLWYNDDKVTRNTFQHGDSVTIVDGGYDGGTTINMVADASARNMVVTKDESVTPTTITIRDTVNENRLGVKNLTLQEGTTLVANTQMEVTETAALGIGATWVLNSPKDSTISAAISSVYATIDKTGDSTLTLTGDNSGYAGFLNVESGTLAAQGSTALGTGVVLVHDDATLSLEGGNSMSAGELCLFDGSTITFVSDAKLNLSESLTLGSDVTWDLGSYAFDRPAQGQSGTATLITGAMDNASIANLLSSSIIVVPTNVHDDDTLKLSYEEGSVILTYTMDDKGDLFWKGGAGNWNTVAANKPWFSGRTGVTPTQFYDGDNVTFDARAAISSVTLTDDVAAGTVTVENGTHVTLRGASDTTTLTAEQIDISGTLGTQVNVAAGTVNIQGTGTWNVSDDKDRVFAGELAGTGTLAKDGAADLVLSGNNSAFNGEIQLNSGTITAGHENALGTETTIAMGNGTELKGSGTIAAVNVNDTTFNTLKDANSAISANLNIVDGSVLTIAGDGATTLSGSISGFGDLYKTGFGTTVMSGDMTYTGSTTVGQGSLVLGKAYRLAGDFTVGIGSTLTLSGAYTAGSTPIQPESGLYVGGTFAMNDGSILDMSNIVFKNGIAELVNADELDVLKTDVSAGGGSVYHMVEGISLVNLQLPETTYARLMFRKEGDREVLYATTLMDDNGYYWNGATAGDNIGDGTWYQTGGGTANWHNSAGTPAEYTTNSQNPHAAYFLKLDGVDGAATVTMPEDIMNTGSIIFGEDARYVLNAKGEYGSLAMDTGSLTGLILRQGSDVVFNASVSQGDGSYFLVEEGAHLVIDASGVGYPDASLYNGENHGSIELHGVMSTLKHVANFNNLHVNAYVGDYEWRSLQIGTLYNAVGATTTLTSEGVTALLVPQRNEINNDGTLNIVTPDESDMVVGLPIVGAGDVYTDGTHELTFAYSHTTDWSTGSKVITPVYATVKSSNLDMNAASTVYDFAVDISNKTTLESGKQSYMYGGAQLEELELKSADGTIETAFHVGPEHVIESFDKDGNAIYSGYAKQDYEVGAMVSEGGSVLYVDKGADMTIASINAGQTLGVGSVTVGAGYEAGDDRNELSASLEVAGVANVDTMTVLSGSATVTGNASINQIMQDGGELVLNSNSILNGVPVSTEPDAALTGGTVTGGTLKLGTGVTLDQNAVIDVRDGGAYTVSGGTGSRIDATGLELIVDRTNTLYREVVKDGGDPVISGAALANRSGFISSGDEYVKLFDMAEGTTLTAKSEGSPQGEAVYHASASGMMTLIGTDNWAAIQASIGEEATFNVEEHIGYGYLHTAELARKTYYVRDAYASANQVTLRDIVTASIDPNDPLQDPQLANVVFDKTDYNKNATPYNGTLTVDANVAVDLFSVSSDAKAAINIASGTTVTANADSPGMAGQMDLQGSGVYQITDRNDLGANIALRDDEITAGGEWDGTVRVTGTSTDLTLEDKYVGTGADASTIEFRNWNGALNGGDPDHEIDAQIQLTSTQTAPTAMKLTGEDDIAYTFTNTVSGSGNINHADGGNVVMTFAGDTSGWNGTYEQLSDTEDSLTFTGGETVSANVTSGNGSMDLTYGGSVETVAGGVNVYSGGDTPTTMNVAYTGGEMAVTGGITSDAQSQLTLTVGDGKQATNATFTGTFAGTENATMAVQSGSTATIGTATIGTNAELLRVVGAEGSNVVVNKGSTLSLASTDPETGYSEFYSVDNKGIIEMKANGGEIHLVDDTAEGNTYNLGNLVLTDPVGTATIETSGVEGKTTNVNITGLTGPKSAAQVLELTNGNGTGTVNYNLGNTDDTKDLNGTIAYGGSGGVTNLVLQENGNSAASAVLETRFASADAVATANIVVDAEAARVLGLSSDGNSANKAMKVSGREDPGDPGNRTLNITGDGNYTYAGTLGSNLDIAYTGDGSQTIEGGVENFRGKVTVDNGSAQAGVLELLNASSVNITDLTIGANDTLDLKKNDSNVGTAVVSGTMKAGGAGVTPSKLDGSLTLNDTAIYDVSASAGSGGLNLTGALTIYEGAMLSTSDMATVWNMKVDDMYDLAFGVTDMTSFGSVDWEQGVDASTVFGNGMKEGEFVLRYSGDATGGKGGNVGAVYLFRVAVPEPTTSTLSLLALAALAARRRRK